DGRDAAFESDARRAGHRCIGGMLHLHNVIACGGAVIAAGDVKKRCPCACRKPTVERVNKNAVGIIWIHRDTLVVPVLWIVAGITAGVSAHTVSERAALGAGHKTPGVTAIVARPDP